MIITEGGRAMFSPGSWDEVRDVRTLTKLLDLTRPDEITEKTRIKGITRLSNILTG